MPSNLLKLKMQKEEHIVLVAETHSKDIGFVSPRTSDAETITTEILSVLQNIDSDIQVIGSDETATNTGVHSEIVQRLEVAPSKSVHWAICGLHFNKLPLHAVFKTLDDDASVPRGFKGPIGKQLPRTFKAY